MYFYINKQYFKGIIFPSEFMEFILSQILPFSLNKNPSLTKFL